MKLSNAKYKVKKDIELIMPSSEKLSNDFFDMGVSKRIIDGILSGKYIPSDDTLEKIYSSIYDNGYLLNKVKEEIYKETNSDLVLFHGSKYGIDTISANGSRPDCDFGRGFYLGETMYQAISFVCEEKNSCVYSFAFNTKGLKVFNIGYSLDWLLAICYFRGTIDKYSNSKTIKRVIEKINSSDLIIAPIADNRMYKVMQNFIDGDINTEVAIHCLSASGLGKQYILKTNKALSNLKLLEKHYLCESEKKDAIKDNQKRGDYIDSKLRISRKEFEGKGKYIDDLL